MQLNINPVHRNLFKDPLTWDVHLDTGNTQEQVHSELVALDWNLAQQSVQPNRLEMGPEPTSPCLKTILNYLRSPEVKNQVIDQLYEGEIYSYWSIDPDDMKRITVSGGMFVLDRPGFICRRHVDSRSLISTGMIMFGAEDNPDQRTFFYRDNTTKERYWESSSKFERGWINANLHNTWHEGYNNSTQDRYSYLFHISLKIF